MALKRMDNVGIVVDDLGGTIDFFRELALELEGRAMIDHPGPSPLLPATLPLRPSDPTVRQAISFRNGDRSAIAYLPFLFDPSCDESTGDAN